MHISVCLVICPIVLDNAYSRYSGFVQLFKIQIVEGLINLLWIMTSVTDQSFGSVCKCIKHLPAIDNTSCRKSVTVSPKTVNDFAQSIILHPMVLLCTSEQVDAAANCIEWQHSFQMILMIAVLTWFRLRQKPLPAYMIQWWTNSLRHICLAKPIYIWCIFQQPNYFAVYNRSQQEQHKKDDHCFLYYWVHIRIYAMSNLSHLMPKYIQHPNFISWYTV